VDHSDKTVEGWNASAPPLYLWSRPDWTMKHKKVAEEHNHTCTGNATCHVSEGSLSDLPVKEEAESSDRLKARSGKEDTGKMPCHRREDNLSDDLPVRKQTEGSNKWNSKSGRERRTTDKATCNVRDANVPADSPAKKRARSEDGIKTGARSVDGIKTAERIAIHEKEADVPDKVPGKKLAEATNKLVSASGTRKEHDRYENRSRKGTPDLIDSLPPEKQVEVAYEEKKIMSRKTIPDEQKAAVCEDGRGANLEESKSGQHNYDKRPAGLSDIKFREGGDSDMSISPRDDRNTRNKSRSYSPSIPTDRFSYHEAAYHDNYMKHATKQPYDPALSGAAYGYGDFDDRSRNVSSSEELGCAAAPTVDPYGLQFREPDDNLYRQISEGWNPRASERYLVADMLMPGYPTRYDGQVGATNLQVSRTPIATAPPTHPRMPGGTDTDDYLQPRYSLGSTGARSSQPSTTFGLSSASAPRGSVMDKYAYGLSGPSGSQSSVMDRYAPSLDGTNNDRTKSFPQQFGGGRPHI
jgi:hypothetical protein